ncbi:MAG TPA: WYL domain-containing protein [Thermoanaerobaculia bacterium]|nr:WYL domain-containing protein [Thermoanaerobaculia bacterium]
MRADRLLSILLQLQLHGRLTSRDLARRLEVSERTIHRDMSALGTSGVPIVAERGVRGGWSLMEGYRTNLTGLSESEVQALFVTKPSRLLADLHLEKASDAALIKLLTILPAVNRRNAEMARQRIHIDVSAWNRGNEPVPHLPKLQDAVWHDRRLRMLYGDECPSERVVDPLGLVAKGSIWYLVARIDGDIRSYRVSRIREAAILDEVFARPEDFDLEQFWQSSTLRFKELLPRYPVVIRTSEPALAWLRRLIRFGGIDNVSEDGDAVRVAMHFDAEEVASAVLLGVGDQIEVIEPVALRDRMITAARAIISRGA